MPEMDKEIEELIKIVRSQKFSLILSDIVKKFEKEFAKWLDVKHVIAVNSGIAARYIAIESLDIQPGDEIIIPPFISVATADSIFQNNARPIFADINTTSFTIDPESIKNCITERTKAIIPIHLAGVPAEMDQLLKIAKENQLSIIEDVSQSFGSKYKGIKVGTLGDLGAFTFYPSKGLNVSEGGVITTNNDKIAEKCRSLVQQNEDSEYIYNRLGWNYRMTEIQGSITRFQLKNLDSMIKIRNKNARFLTSSVKNLKGITAQHVPEYCEPAFNYWIGRIHPDIIGMNLEQFIESFPKEIIFQPKLFYETKFYHNKVDSSTFNLPNAEKISKELFAMEITPEVSHLELTKNINIVKRLLNKF